ncbi:hypothetical protein RJT34_13896 [Clitoria ternatea]|uniref:Uncharacterized protein n=1 Tax=Clitoria ternatea TaxID=43366 RepID=A0AAN9JPR4_CLITE
MLVALREKKGKKKVASWSLYYGDTCFYTSCVIIVLCRFGAFVIFEKHSCLDIFFIFVTSASDNPKSAGEFYASFSRKICHDHPSLDI